MLLVLEVEGGGHEPRNVSGLWKPLESGKGKKTDFLLELPEGSLTLPEF